MSSDDDVGHCIEHEPHISGVRGAREVSIELFLVPSSIQGQETLLDIVLGIVVRVGAWCVRVCACVCVYVCVCMCVCDLKLSVECFCLQTPTNTYANLHTAQDFAE